MKDSKGNFIWQKLRVCFSVSKSVPANTPFWKIDIKLSRSDNMIWSCPVFDNYDRAVEYMNWDKDEIREMTITALSTSEK